MAVATGPAEPTGTGSARGGPSLPSGRSLVVATALPPLAWLVHIAVLPALVPLACETGQKWPLHVATVATLAVAVVGLVGSHRSRSRARALGDTVEEGDGGDDAAADDLLRRARTWSTWGVVTGWLFTVLIVAEHVPVFVLPACPP